MLLFLFWLIRILCLVAFIVNLVVVNVNSFYSLLYLIFGFLASVNIYGLGLLAHETYKNLPSAFILFRLLQLLLLISTKCISWYYLGIHVGLDIIVFALFVYDNKYDFILKLENDENIKTIVVRDDLNQ